LKAHDKIMINKTTGNINNNQVIKWLLFLCFADIFD
jgi:hypothetical protein